MDYNLFDILFIDIETAAQFSNFEDIPERMKPLWEKKSTLLRNENQLNIPDLYKEKAAIYAEFGQIICIGIGGLFLKNEELFLKVKTLTAATESQLLEDFAQVLHTHKAKESLSLCAHNGKEFDFPYIARRMLIKGIKLPKILNLAGKKPWQINHLDTMELWKFGDYKNYTSLDLLAAVFDIPSSKSDISGADVSRVFHEENNLQKIAEYCSRDVQVLAQLFLKMQTNERLNDSNIVNG